MAGTILSTRGESQKGLFLVWAGLLPVGRKAVTYCYAEGCRAPWMPIQSKILKKMALPIYSGFLAGWQSYEQFVNIMLDVKTPICGRFQGYFPASGNFKRYWMDRGCRKTGSCITSHPDPGGPWAHPGVSRIRVTGPSLIKETCMAERKRPVAVGMPIALTLRTKWS